MTIRTYESLPTAAARIGVSVKTIRRRIAEGVLPVVRSGRSLHLDPKDVDALFRRLPAAHGVRAQLSGTSSSPTRVMTRVSTHLPNQHLRPASPVVIQGPGGIDFITAL